MSPSGERSPPHRLIPGLMFRLDDDSPTPEQLRQLHAQGELEPFGEELTRYQGIPPDDERLAPCWALVEELDTPVGTHVGAGPPGAPYLGSTGYRPRLHSPIIMTTGSSGQPGVRRSALPSASTMSAARSPSASQSSCA